MCRRIELAKKFGVIIMEIIKRGNVPAERVWQGTCKACKSIVRAKQSEVTAIRNDQGDDTQFSWEVCPVCKLGPYGGLLLYPQKEHL